MADNNWHTGKPTENGRYLVWCDYGIGADTDDFKDGKWVFYGSHVVAWQKITPFEAGEEK